MSDRDRALLAILAVGVALSWYSSLPKGLGWPSLASGRGPDQGGRKGAKKAPKGSTTSPSSSGATSGPGAAGDGVIDVSSPRVVSLEQYKREQAARAARAARAAKKNKPKP